MYRKVALFFFPDTQCRNHESLQNETENESSNHINVSLHEDVQTKMQH